MKIPLKWLEEYISLKAHPDQIAKTLTSLGLEVDAVETISPGFTGVVVGSVLKAEPHPQADKLRVATVSDGLENFQVVCGAPNCREGIKVAFAKIGATLPDEGDKPFVIKKSSLRGVESFGMLCSAKELQLGEDQDGIMILPDHLTVGQDLGSLYGDIVFEISLTPNLAHCQSLAGVVKELSAATETPYRIPTVTVKEDPNLDITSLVSVLVEDQKRCPRYTCRLIKGVTIAPSPQWLQQRLSSCGVRSINNVVDVTNLVMLETGQPLHAFDFAKISQNRVVIRTANHGELFTTLDGIERTLQPEDLLICDGEKPIALAGVMGGNNSEISPDTVDILLESAYFEPTTIRKTSKRLGLQTDASKRFERGCDPNIPAKVADRAAQLIAEIAGGVVAKGIIDTHTDTFSPHVIAISVNKINRLLGTQLSIGEVTEIFQRLQFSVEADEADVLKVTVPTYRVDITQQIDLVEEVARIYGYDNIPRKPAKYRGSTQKEHPIIGFESTVRCCMIAEGLQEFLTCDLIGPTLSSIIGQTVVPDEKIVKVLNPVSVEQSSLRTSLLPGLLQVVKYNVDRNHHDISGFEIGRVYFREEEKYKENLVLGIIMTGDSRPYHYDPKPTQVDLFDLKGILENLLAHFRIPNIRFEKGSNPIFHPGRQATIRYNGSHIGSFGEIHPDIQNRLDVPSRLYFAEIELHDLADCSRTLTQLCDLPNYPASDRDWTLTLPDTVTVDTVMQTIHSVPSRLLEKVFLLDIYRSEKLGEGKSNHTYRFVYRDKKKTISQESVDSEHARIEKEVTKRLSTLEE